VRQWLLGFYFSASGDADLKKPPISVVEHGRELKDRFQYPEKLPPWLREEDLDFYAAEFERTGFTGGLNRYRNVDRDWEDLVAYRYRPIEIPALFIGGAKDGPTIWGKKAIENFPRSLPNLHRSILFEGCGHLIQQERPEETHEALIDFLKAIHAA
jgi:pimeloyl-ACP methyl ester carboxylesterase